MEEKKAPILDVFKFNMEIMIGEMIPKVIETIILTTVSSVVFVYIALWIIKNNLWTI